MHEVDMLLEVPVNCVFALPKCDSLLDLELWSQITVGELASPHQEYCKVTLKGIIR